MKKHYTMRMNLFNKLTWLLLFGLGVFLVAYFLIIAKVQLAGDIVEYHGITQSIIYDRSLALSPKEQTSLEQVVHPAYFQDPGYYVLGRNQQRYPVHFFFYSLLSVPLRLVLKFFHQNELKTLWMTNIASFIITVGVLWKWYVKHPWARIVMLILMLLSPLMSFFIWPGPDLWYLCVLLIAVFAFFQQQLLLSSLLIAFASWHSQPLIVLAAAVAAYAVLKNSRLKLKNKTQELSLNLKTIGRAIPIGLLALIPYAYNYFAFEAFTPWTALKDGWTQIRGFGLHNASLWKLFEQVFDLNLGQFWYAPVLFILTVIAILYLGVIKKHRQYLIFAALLIITAFFYQTNPGWHYGTSGFGPGRHGLFFIPFVIFGAYQLLKTFNWKSAVLMIIIVGTQLGILSTNNFLEPDLTKTLHHSVFAEFVLHRYPEWYSPTPEIFVDRTNHLDVAYPTSAIYKKEGRCIKAYILKTDIPTLEAECGPLNDAQKAKLDNEFLRLANYPRQVVTTEATFWPQSDSCADWFVSTSEKPFVCLKTATQFIQETGLQYPDRLSTVPEFNFPGIWKITSGEPILITVPAGYIIHHKSFDGAYVEFAQN